MKKLAIIFPGVGYTCTKPLLYYTASMAAERGYEIIRLDYGQDIHTFHGRTPAELEPIIKLAIKRTLPQLENVPFSEYDDIIFISKSIGTTIACQLETALQLKGKVHQFLMTPIPSTLRYLSDINGSSSPEPLIHTCRSPRYALLQETSPIKPAGFSRAATTPWSKKATL